MKAAARYSLLRLLITVVGLLLAIAMLWIPLQAVQPMVDALAGKNTRVSLVITLTVVLTVAISGGLGAMWVKMRRQRAQIQQMRTRIQVLEARQGVGE
jgi:hypothetical protein